jgi:hypothetical protein
MANISPLSAFWLLLFVLITLFYLFRLTAFLIWMRRFDAESEVGHGLMALGMVFMLAPLGLQTPDIVRWNIMLFTFASLWFSGRLLVRKPLLAIFLRTNGEHSSRQADAIHVFMYVGMAYMFLLMDNMLFSMIPPAIYANCIFFVAFAFLLLSYGREIGKDLQATRIDWLKLGADIAHALMSGVMGWMFLEMISMTMRMGAL